MTKQQLREAIRKIIRQELNELPLPAVVDPNTEEDVETIPYTIPGPDKEDDRTLNPEDPDSLPNVAPKATEQNAIAKLIAIYKDEKAKLNELNKKKYK